MKITLESTDQIVQYSHNGGPPCPARLWKGRTENGIAIQAMIPRIAVEETSDLAQFQRELQETPAPVDMADIDAFPMRMLI